MSDVSFFAEKLGQFPGSMQPSFLSDANTFQHARYMLSRTVVFVFAILAIANCGFAQRSDARMDPPVQDQDQVTRLQIYLDEHSFGPGKIDGRWGDFVGKALQRFQAANGQQPSGQIDAALRQELQKISPVFSTYKLTDSDLHWVGKVPAQPARMAHRKKILYRSALDFV